MSIGSEFKAFIQRGSVLDLAVGVVIGGAFGKIVNGFVEDLVMPLVGALTPSGNWREITLTPLKFKVGHLLGVSLDFLIVAMVVFLVVVKLGSRLKLTAAPAAPATKVCPECQSDIPISAKKCKFCQTPQH